MTHKILSIETETAPYAGALDGFRYICACGESRRCFDMVSAQHEGQDHVDYMGRRK
jgi:hypothetical protein